MLVDAAGVVPKEVIFDLDGTLIDSAASILTAFAAVLRRRGIEPVVPLTPALIGPPLRDTLTVLSGSDDHEVLASLGQAFKDYYDTEGYKGTRIFPGVEEMLSRLAAAGIALHIATNKREKPTLAILAHLGWKRLFKSVFSSDMSSKTFKNKAEMLHAQLREQAIASTSAAYVGDRAEDGHAADANGVPFYLAMWGYSGRERQEWRRHWIEARTPADIPRVVSYPTP